MSKKKRGKFKKWNEWPRWLKWGLIFSLLNFMFWIVLSIINFIFTFFYLDKIQTNLLFDISIVNNTLTFLLPSFLIGALIGWIVGKIKSNQLKNKQIKE